MKKWKKVCAAMLSAAMMFTMIEPAGVIMAKAEEGDASGIVTGNSGDVSASSISGILEPTYELKLDAGLEVVSKVGASSITAKAANVGVWNESIAEYTGNEQFSAGRSKKGLKLGQYGLLLEGAELGESYTVSAWLNPTTVPQFTPMIMIGAGDNTSDWISLAGTGRNEYMFWTGHSGRGNQELQENYIPFTPGTWAHFTLSVDHQIVTLYQNGEPLMTMNMSDMIDPASGHKIMFGVNYWDKHPDSILDEVKIYDRALTSDEAASLYTLYDGFTIEGKSNVRLNQSINLEAKAESDTAGMQVVWSSDDESVATVNDGIVTGHAAGETKITAALVQDSQTVKAATTLVTVVEPKVIADFDFNKDAEQFAGAEAIAIKQGTVSLTPRDDSGDFALQLDETGYLDVKKTDGSSLLTGLKEFSLSFDCYSTKTGASWSFFAAPNASPQNWLSERYIAAFDLNDSLTLERYMNLGVRPLNVSAKYSEGWKHVDAVFEEDNVTLYINGVSAGTVKSDYPVKSILKDNSILLIGRGNWSTYGEYFNGQIDNYKIYNYARTAEEIVGVKVDSIAVSGQDGASELLEGNTLKLSATVFPENAANKAVTWKSLSPEVATVDENGLVTGVSAGTVTITAEAQDGSSVSGSIDLIVKKETFTVEAVSSDETMGTVSGVGTYDKGTEVTLIARENSGYKFVGWYDGDVLLTDRSYYTFVVGQDCSFTARFELDDIKVSSITVSSQNGANELMEGDTLQLNAEVFPENATNKAVIWKSPNPEYATVDENGLVTGVAESGTIYIMAEAQDGSGVSGSIALVVKKKTFTVEAVSADETMGTVSGGGTYDKGGQATLRATANSGYRFVGWYAGEDCVSETSVYTFTVDQNYSLTAKFKEITVGVKINANAAEAQIKVKAGDAPVQTGESYNGSVSQGVNVTVTAGDVAGYQFAYWKDLDTNKTVSDKKAYTFTAVYNVNLQAVYREEQAFTIIFKTNETFANKVLKEESVKESAPVDVPQPFEMAGYTFAGWDTTGDGTADVTADTTSVTVDKNQVWTAVYTVNEVLHLVQTWGGGTIVKVDGKANDSTSVSVKRDTLVTVKADAPASGHYFAGWSMDGGNTLVSTREEFSFFVKKDTTIYAVYSQNETKVSPTIAVSGVSRVRNSATGKDSVRIEVTWDVPEGFTAVNEGILRTYNDSLRNDLYIGKAGVTNNSCGKGYRNGTYAYSFNIGNTSANLVKNIHTVGYLVYKDAQGTVHTIYTEVETLHSNN